MGLLYVNNEIFVLQSIKGEWNTTVIALEMDLNSDEYFVVMRNRRNWLVNEFHGSCMCNKLSEKFRILTMDPYLRLCHSKLTPSIVKN